MLDIKQYGNEILTISAVDQNWTDEDCEELKKHNIIYNKGCFAIQIIPSHSEAFASLVRIGVEDDGSIRFTPNSETFSSYWINDLINVLQETSEKLTELEQ